MDTDDQPETLQHWDLPPWEPESTTAKRQMAATRFFNHFNETKEARGTSWGGRVSYAVYLLMWMLFPGSIVIGAAFVVRHASLLPLVLSPFIWLGSTMALAILCAVIAKVDPVLREYGAARRTALFDRSPKVYGDN